MIWWMHIACWIPKATNAHTDCVILNAFPLQQWPHERTSMLHDTYNACLVFCIFVAFGKWSGPTWRNYTLSCLQKVRKNIKTASLQPSGLLKVKSVNCSTLSSSPLSLQILVMQLLTFKSDILTYPKSDPIPLQFEFSFFPPPTKFIPDVISIESTTSKKNYTY
jgi:hypothetical protein